MLTFPIPAHSNTTPGFTGAQQSRQAATGAARSAFVSQPRAAFLAATTLTFIKPRLRKLLRPVTARLARMGVTANQVTIISLIGSVLVGAMLCCFPTHPASFTALRIWLVMRTICATIDGTLAIEFGQKSRLGGFLNEVGDIVSDIALFFPLAFIPPFSVGPIAFLIALIVLSEVAGIIGPLLGSDRRLEGPLGKSDRSIVLAIIAWVIVVCGGLPKEANILLPTLSLGLLVTVWNRLRFALADPHRRPKGEIATRRAFGVPAFSPKSRMSRAI